MNFIAAISLSLVFLCPSACASSQDRKIKVIASLFPLYDFARMIGGPNADVQLLMPPGVEPHDYEPSAGDMLKIGSADMFIFTSNDMEPWIEDVLKGVSNPHLVVVDSSKGVPRETVELENNQSKKTIDPHIWLDFSNCRIIIGNILASYIRVDPRNKGSYEKNADDLAKKIAALDSEYTTQLGNCKKDVFIEGGHYTFGYLARRYHLHYISSIGISPNAEPRPRDLISLVSKVKQYGVRYIYFEELVSPKVARAIAQESGAILLELNGAHNLTKDEMKRGVTFIELMELNLKNLKMGLECQ